MVPAITNPVRPALVGVKDSAAGSRKWFAGIARGVVLVRVSIGNLGKGMEMRDRRGVEWCGVVGMNLHCCSSSFICFPLSVSDIPPDRIESKYPHTHTSLSAFPAFALAALFFCAFGMLILVGLIYLCELYIQLFNSMWLCNLFSSGVV